MKKKIFIGMNLILMFIITNKVYATNVEMKFPEELNMGDTVSVKIEVNEINQVEGINVIQGKLEYDKDIFEKVENEDFKLSNNWSIAYNDENTESEGKFILLNLAEGIKEDQEIGEVELKVKDNIKTTDTIIKLSQMCTAEDDDVIELEDNVSNVKINGKFSMKYFFTSLINKFFIKK